MSKQTREEIAERRLVVYVDRRLSSRLRVEAARRRETLSALVEKAIRAYLKKEG